MVTVTPITVITLNIVCLFIVEYFIVLLLSSQISIGAPAAELRLHEVGRGLQLLDR